MKVMQNIENIEKSENIHPLTKWVINKIQKEYKDDVALLIGIKGHSTDGDSHGECFDFFVPATERANELAETFIIDGVGHDLYPRSWERLENSVNLNDMSILLDQAIILYSRSQEDTDRFLDCKNRMWQNLKNHSFVYGKALECMDKALDIYRTMIFEEKLYRVRSEADCILEFLSRAIAYMNHTYTESAIYSENQAYNGDLENRIYHCSEMKIVPDGYFANARKLLEVQDVEELKQTIFALLKTTRTFILERKPAEKSESDETKINYSDLAAWYQELSLTWRRIRYFCKNNMAEKAYIDACYLQEEFLYIAQEYKIEELNLLDSYNKENLSLLADRSNQLEKIIQGILAEHNVKINSYNSVEEFLTNRG